MSTTTTETTTTDITIPSDLYVYRDNAPINADRYRDAWRFDPSDTCEASIDFFESTSPLDFMHVGIYYNADVPAFDFGGTSDTEISPWMFADKWDEITAWVQDMARLQEYLSYANENMTADPNHELIAKSSREWFDKQHAKSPAEVAASRERNYETSYHRFDGELSDHDLLKKLTMAVQTIALKAVQK